MVLGGGLRRVYAAGADREPAAWFLMTNRAADGFEAVYDKVCRYAQRRKIERFRYALKSGRAAEKLHARTMDKTAVSALMYSVIAAAIMNLTYIIVRLKPESRMVVQNVFGAPYIPCLKAGGTANRIRICYGGKWYDR
jgi:hypothetical protein